LINEETVNSKKIPVHKNVLFFKDLKMSISEWCPFGQNAISAFNDSIDSLKGVKSSLLTGKVDEEPSTTGFNIKPMFTRIMLEDFDRYNWIKFKAFVEYPEEVEQIEEVGTHVDKSGFINYALELNKIGDKTANFSLDDTTAIVADLIEDTSLMMGALLTQFQRRILRLVYGDTPFRPKFTIAYTSALLPEQKKVEGYHDGEDQENEINQLVGIAYKFFDLPTKEKVIMGTNGMIFISSKPEAYGSVLSFYSFVRGLQLFQTVFFNRIRKIWDIIKDLRKEILHIKREESVGLLEQELSELSADIVLIEEVMNYMHAGSHDMKLIWNAHSSKLNAANKHLVEHLEIPREINVISEKLEDMQKISRGLVEEIQGLRDMINTLAEKRMREMSKLMSDNVQQGADAQMAMAANVKASRYTGVAVKILSAISSGFLGIRISDLIMKALDDFNDSYWHIELLGTENFYGGYLQVIVGFAIWILCTIIFFKLIKITGAKVKEQKLASDYFLNLRIPVDKRSTPEKIQQYIDSKNVVFHNVELTGHRTSWYHKEKKGEDTIFYTLTMCYDMRLGHIYYMHATTEDKKGDAMFSADFLLKDLQVHGLISKKDERYIKKRMGFPIEGDE